MHQVTSLNLTQTQIITVKLALNLTQALILAHKNAMKNAQMNIPHFKSTLFNFSREIVTPNYLFDWKTGCSLTCSLFNTLVNVF